MSAESQAIKANSRAAFDAAMREVERLIALGILEDETIGRGESSIDVGGVSDENTAGRWIRVSLTVNIKAGKL